MKLISFKECLKRGKQAIDEALIPIRVAQGKSQADMEKLKIDEKIIGLDIKMQELILQSPLPFDKIIECMDESDLLNRRKAQFSVIVEELFPEEKKGK